MKLTVIGHAHINRSNRSDFLKIGGVDNVIFMHPAHWKGAFFENYDSQSGFGIASLPMTENGYIPFLPSIGRTDILWLDEEPYLPQAHCILRKYRHVPVKIIRTAQNLRKHSLLFENLYRDAFRHSEHIVAVGQTSARVVRSVTGIKNVDIIPLSIDDSFFDQLLWRSGNHGAKLRLGFAARLEKAKGTDMLIDIISRLDIPAEVIIAGAGREETYLTDALNSIGIDYEMRGFIPHMNMPKYYGSIDVFLNLSQTTAIWKEQQGRTVIEAAASGAYVISTDSGELDYVMDGLGAKFPEDNADAFISCIRGLHHDRQKMEEEARMHAENARKFSSAAIGKSIKALLGKYGYTGH